MTSLFAKGYILFNHTNEALPQRKGEKDESDPCGAFIDDIERVCVAGVKKEICHDV